MQHPPQNNRAESPPERAAGECHKKSRPAPSRCENKLVKPLEVRESQAMQSSPKTTSKYPHQKTHSASRSPSDHAFDTMIHHDPQDLSRHSKGESNDETSAVESHPNFTHDDSKRKSSHHGAHRSPDPPRGSQAAHIRSKSTSAIKEKPRRRRHNFHSKRSRSVHPSNVSREIDSPVWRLKSYGHEEDQNLASFYADSRRIFDEYDAWVAGHKGEDHDATTTTPHNEQPPRQSLCQHTISEISEGKPASEQIEADAGTIDKVEAVHVCNALKPTVMEWTSPTTRRREYAKIDRSTHGIRGFWRRFAPACCQASNAPMPFYDGQELKRKKGKTYEGSVRRFRMDIDDEDGGDDEFVHHHDVKEIPHALISRLSQVESTLSSRWRKLTDHNDMKRKNAAMRDQEKFCY